MVMARSFPLLIHSLCEKHHGGCLLTMAQARHRIPYTTLWRWQRGLSRSYDLNLVARLCDHYDLDPGDTWALIRRDAKTLAADEALPLPDLSGVRRGPIPAVKAGARTKRRPVGRRSYLAPATARMHRETGLSVILRRRRHSRRSALHGPRRYTTQPFALAA